MKTKILFTGFISLILGGIAGFAIAVNVFAIHIDILGIPYKNIPVQTTKDITIKQGNTEILIPKGTSLVYGYTAKEQPYYFIEFYGELFGDSDSFTNIDTRKYFYIENTNEKGG